MIEAKNEKGENGYVTREDHGQLLEACGWFKTHYPDWSHDRLVAMPEARITESVTIGETRALDAALKSLVDDTMAAITAIIDLPSDARRQVEARRILEERRLTPAGLRSRFVDFAVVADRRGEAVKMF